jgi:hypothetical protein
LLIVFVAPATTLLSLQSRAWTAPPGDHHRRPSSSPCRNLEITRNRTRHPVTAVVDFAFAITVAIAVAVVVTIAIVFAVNIHFAFTNAIAVAVPVTLTGISRRHCHRCCFCRRRGRLSFAGWLSR